MTATILCVEDEPEYRRLLADLLNMQGFNTKTAADGASALNAYDDIQPDLILADVNMPHMTGFDMLEVLQQRSHHAPVLFLTAMGQKNDQIQGYNLGAEDYIMKPVDFDVLMARIHSKLAQSKRAQLKQQKSYEDFTTMLMRLLEHATITPLNAICGYSQLLTNREADDPIRMMLDPIVESATHMSDIIRNVKDIGAIASGNYEPRIDDIYWEQLEEELRHGIQMQSAVLDADPYIRVKTEQLPNGYKADVSLLFRMMKGLLADAITNAECHQYDVSLHVGVSQTGLLLQVNDKFRDKQTAHAMLKLPPTYVLDTHFVEQVGEHHAARLLQLTFAAEVARLHGGTLHAMVRDYACYTDIRLPLKSAFEAIATTDEAVGDQPQHHGNAA